MKQLKISLPDDLRASLEAASAKAGHSLGEEIRRRLEQTLTDDGIDPKTRELMAAIDRFAVLVRLQSNRLDWHSHPAAHRIMRNMITARLTRLRPPGEAVFGQGELAGHPLVDSTDPEAIGLALEAVDFHRQVDDDKLRESLEKTMQEIRNRFDKGE